MKRVWLSRNVLEKITTEAEDKAPLETGGVLAGYCSADDNDVVVTEMVGPGSNAVHRRLSFRPDYEYHREEIGRIFDDSGGEITYLGDWHTHPASRSYLSWLDKRALRNIAAFPGNYMNNPIMLVLGQPEGAKDKWSPKVWRILTMDRCFFWSTARYVLLSHNTC